MLVESKRRIERSEDNGGVGEKERKKEREGEEKKDVPAAAVRAAHDRTAQGGEENMVLLMPTRKPVAISSNWGA
jgi:hypothetical protein